MVRPIMSPLLAVLCGGTGGWIFETFLRVLGFCVVPFAITCVVLLAALFYFIHRKEAWFQSALHLTNCFLLTRLWIIRFRARAIAPGLTFVTFVAAGFFTYSELLLKLWEMQERSRVPPFLSWFLQWCKFRIELIYNNPSALVLLGLVELLIIWHHYDGHLHRHRETTTLAILGELLSPLNKLTAFLDSTDSEEEETGAKKTFMVDFCAAFKRILKERGIKSVNICLLEFDVRRSVLAVLYESSSGNDFDPDFTLGIDQGGAGNAFSTKELIYIPNVKYEYGVALRGEQLKLVPGAYQQGKHRFKSILCVPILVPPPPPGASNASKAVAVLNFSCAGKSTFSEPDFVIAKLAGTVLSLMYN
jgi:hypothetical protein